MSKRAAIYTRASRDRVGAGLSVERQEEDCCALARQLKLTVVTVRRDNDLSAYSGKPRPGYAALLEDIHTGAVDVILAWHGDRLHRSPVELEDYIVACETRGVPTHTVKAGPLDLATPSGRMVARQLGAVARYEVEHMIERQKRAKLQAATAGKWRGGRRPYGYEDDGVTVRKSEAAEVLRASEAILRGSSLRSIAIDMNRRGLVTSTGKAWRQDTIRKVLLRARNAGLIEVARPDGTSEVLGGAQWPAIVPEATWRGVVAVLTNPERRTQFSSVRRWMGSGLYLCFCGTVVRATTSATTRRRPQPVQYACAEGKHVARNAQEVDDLIGKLVVRRLQRDDAIELLAADEGHDVADLHVQAAAIRARLDDLAVRYAAEELTGSQLATATALLRKRLRDVEEQTAAAGEGSVFDGIVGVDDVPAAWASFDLDRRRAIINELMVVTLLPARKGRPAGWKPGQSYFDPETVAVDWRR